MRLIAIILALSNKLNLLSSFLVYIQCQNHFISTKSFLFFTVILHSIAIDFFNVWKKISNGSLDVFVNSKFRNNTF